jgi:D-galactarolactone isomerase
LADYLQVRRTLGLSRAVIVQPNGYGFDNTCTLEALAALGATARGIATVPIDVADVELERLTHAGVRGVRFHLLPGGMLGWDAVEPMAARIASFGWHIQLQLDGRELPRYEAALGRLPVPLVIDHNGKFLEPVAIDHPGFKALLRLLDRGKTWVKLSAPYETSRQGPPHYADVGALARALVQTNPERCVWASNWPHPGRNPPPDSAALLDLLLEWADDDATRRRILVDNPAALYGF